MWCDYRAHYAVVTPKVNTTCVTRMALRNGCNVEAVIGYASHQGSPSLSCLLAFIVADVKV